MSLKYKFILGFLTIVLFMAAVGRIHVQVGKKAIRDYDAIVNEIVPAVIGLGQIRSALLKMQSEVFGNVLVENEVEVFQLASQRKQKWETEYFSRSEKPEDKQIIYEINKTETNVYQLGLELIQEKKQGTSVGLKDKKGELDHATEELNNIIDRAIATRAEDLSESNKTAQRNAARAGKITNIIVLFSILFAVVIGFLLSRSVVNPISKLTETAKNLGKGNLQARVHIHSKNEIGTLATTFNQMAGSLDRLLKEVVLARDEAERANRLKSDFLRNVSHELKTPMAVITGMNDLILDSDINQDQRECAQSVRGASYALMQLISDMLDFSKSAAGKTALDKIPFELSDLVQSVIDPALTKAEEKKLDLSLDYTPESSMQLSGDPGKVSQLLTILVSNAIKFTEKGFVKLRVECERKSEGRATVRFSVIDSGIGIAKADLPHVFDKLIQADSSVTRRFCGIGLGLTICSQLVELMQGEIGAESESGKGSIFWVRLTLPMILTLAQKREQSMAEARRAEVSRNVLLGAILLDENESDQRLEKYMLEKLGCSVYLAPAMEDAVKTLKEAPHDVVFLHCPMPELSHYATLAETCKVASLSRHLAVIAMVPNFVAEDRQACLKAGMDDAVSKPVTFNDFKAVLEKWVLS